MSVTRDTFVESYAEFTNAPEALVDAKISEATARVPLIPWGDLRTQGIMKLTARLLALTPQGRAMQLVNKDGSTVYDEDWRAMKRAVSAGYRVT